MAIPMSNKMTRMDRGTHTCRHLPMLPSNKMTRTDRDTHAQALTHTHTGTPSSLGKQNTDTVTATLAFLDATEFRPPA
eukprot:362227-Chlamydomonas_euryale.AAC.6